MRVGGFGSVFCLSINGSSVLLLYFFPESASQSSTTPATSLHAEATLTLDDATSLPIEKGGGPEVIRRTTKRPWESETAMQFPPILSHQWHYSMTVCEVSFFR